MKLNLWPVKGINVYDLPDTLKSLVFPYMGANEEDCIPQHEQDRPDSHRELRSVETSKSINLPTISDAPNTSNVLKFPNR